MVKCLANYRFCLARRQYGYHLSQGQREVSNCCAADRPQEIEYQKGDRLLVDVQDGVIVLIPQPKRYTDHLQGLHSEIWKDIDVQNYTNGEREAWTNSAKD